MLLIRWLVICKKQIFLRYSHTVCERGYLGTHSTWGNRTAFESSIMWWRQTHLKITYESDFSSSSYRVVICFSFGFSTFGGPLDMHIISAFFLFCLGCWLILKFNVIVAETLGMKSTILCFRCTVRYCYFTGAVLYGRASEFIRPVCKPHLLCSLPPRSLALAVLILCLY